MALFLSVLYNENTDRIVQYKGNLYWRIIMAKKVVVMGGESESYKRIFGEHGIGVAFCASKDEDEIAAAAKDADAILFTSTIFTN